MIQPIHIFREFNPDEEKQLDALSALLSASELVTEGETVVTTEPVSPSMKVHAVDTSLDGNLITEKSVQSPNTTNTTSLRSDSANLPGLPAHLRQRSFVSLSMQTHLWRH
jgi:hypothetical protein